MANIYGTNFNDNNSYTVSWPYFIYYPELKGTAGDDYIYGYAGNDILSGYSGNDTLDGGTGADTMTGGSGDDVYLVDNSSDKVVENDLVILPNGLHFYLSQGNDIVKSSISYTLPAYVENLQLNDAAYFGNGNNLSNSITGTSAANYLSGLDGGDWLYGGAGDDRLAGGNGNDYLYGDYGNDVLIGGPGIDWLRGGGGNDQFDFESYSGTNTDAILDFYAPEDTIGLDVGGGGNPGIFGIGLTFNADGHLSAGSYFEGSFFNGNAGQSSGIYVDTSNGYIWYNPTSGVAGDSYHFATIDPATIVGGISSLSANDFIAVHYHS
ncbi:MAG: hypothetical protein HRU78_02165 [Gammaproteobacteria bacterium]|nr:MAG: hypothetical protein HRU78_02165 [Gammaproteobacteria bacterium]